MIQNRRLRLETLECRRVLAAASAVTEPSLVVAQVAAEVALNDPESAGRDTELAAQQEKWIELGLRAVNDAGETLERLVVGQSFWLEFNAQDLRPGARGVYAAFFDLVVPTQLFEITGPVEYTSGYSSIKTGSVSGGEIDDLGAIGTGLRLSSSDHQPLLRIGARALDAGRVLLQPEPADGIGTGSLLYGLLSEVPVEMVSYRPLELSITAKPIDDPLDVNGSGSVTAGDALEIVNFLNRYGNVSLADLEATVRGTATEGESNLDAVLAHMQRLDTNRDAIITALDALFVINDLHRQSLHLSVTTGAENEATFDVLHTDSGAVGLDTQHDRHLEDDDEDDEEDAKNETTEPAIVSRARWASS